MSLFVVGTGTGVGKTVMSALLLARYGRSGRLAYWKPVATGGDDDRDTTTVARLSGVPASSVLPELHHFSPPVSPHLAARWAGATIELAPLVAELSRHEAAWSGPGQGLLVEGVGGVLVPLNDRGDLLVDFLAAAPRPCLVVAHAGLGTINHTLLTLEALAARRLAVVGVVLVGEPHGENRLAIERFGRVPVVAEVPVLAPLTPATVAAAAAELDPEGRLEPWLIAPEVAP
ncbi:MAG: dethiobiotin synthase [Thermoanaerobaculia bacterium]|nr:dethiobiotin synthase [Thermoanaerobaculia bacterium]